MNTASVRGVEARRVRVEVNLSGGLPSFMVVGLAHGSVREGRERVAAALRNSGFGLPNRRITVNLAPADLRKDGTGFDLPIAVGILAAGGQVPEAPLVNTAVLGELGLDGAVRPVPGVLPVVMWARDAGLRAVVVPGASGHEARLVDGIAIVAVRTLEDVVRYLVDGTIPDDGPSPQRDVSQHASRRLDLHDVRGQEVAKRALEIVAAGGHNLRLVGPPGTGKTMLARRLPGILPALALREQIEVARIRSVTGHPVEGASEIVRPFRAPHHSISYAGLAGGGTPIRPGEISMAHHGVLFLDELPEFRRDALEALRQPLEEGEVTLARAGGAVRFPARFVLVAAMNGCPCGHRGDGTDRCLCDPGLVARYTGRVSGPLMDRIDLHVEVGPLPSDAGATRESRASSAAVARRVEEARALQADRFGERADLFANAHMRGGDLDLWCRGTPAARTLLRKASGHAALSARGFDRVRRVARTIADLAGSGRISEAHVAEALNYRVGEH